MELYKKSLSVSVNQVKGSFCSGNLKCCGGLTCKRKVFWSSISICTPKPAVIVRASNCGSATYGIGFILCMKLYVDRGHVHVIISDLKDVKVYYGVGGSKISEIVMDASSNANFVTKVTGKDSAAVTIKSLLIYDVYYEDEDEDSL